MSDEFIGNFVGTANCVLCRSKFPATDDLENNDWQSTFRAVFMDRDIESTEASNWFDKDGVKVTSSSESSAKRSIRILPYHHQIGTAMRRAFCFHDWCYSVMTWKLRGYNLPALYKLAQSLEKSPLFEHVVEDGGQFYHPVDLENILASLGRPLSRLQPLFLSKLPPEIRSHIWEQVSLASAHQALILVAEETSRLTKLIQDLEISVFGLKEGTFLSAKTITIFGTEYIRHISEGLVCHAFEESLVVRGPVTGLDFIAKYHGVCAFRLTGPSWESAWIGKVPSSVHARYGKIQGDLRELRCEYNGLNLLSISTAFPAHQILWDRPDFPTAITDPHRSLIAMPWGKEDAAGFFRYVPLIRNGQYATGITLYWWRNRIGGFKTHFGGTSISSGRLDGIALHYPFQADERITHAWLRVSRRPTLSPGQSTELLSLTIETTSGRMHTFGPHVESQDVMRNAYTWIDLVNQGCVAGLYYENSPWNIRRLGVCSDDETPVTRSSKPRYFRYNGEPPKIGGSPSAYLNTMPVSNIFLSHASLYGLSKIDVCRVGDRCTGLKLQYLNDPTTILGQWYTGGNSKHSCILADASSKPKYICFIMSEENGKFFVNDIDLPVTEAAWMAGDEALCFRFDQTIAWWFTEKHDEILLWAGDLVDVPDESVVSSNKDGMCPSFKTARDALRA